MYRYLIRPILFLLSPETIHHLLISFLRVAFKIPGVLPLVKGCYHLKDKALETEFLGMSFSNPVGLAAGFDKNASVFKEFQAFGFSFIEVGTVTPLGQAGNEKPRSFRIKRDRGLINRMGFNNHGAGAAAAKLARPPMNGLWTSMRLFSMPSMTVWTILWSMSAVPIYRTCANYRIRILWNRFWDGSWNYANRERLKSQYC